MRKFLYCALSSLAFLAANATSDYPKPIEIKTLYNSAELIYDKPLPEECNFVTLYSYADGLDYGTGYVSEDRKKVTISNIKPALIPDVSLMYYTAIDYWCQPISDGIRQPAGLKWLYRGTELVNEDCRLEYMDGKYIQYIWFDSYPPEESLKPIDVKQYYMKFEFPGCEGIDVENFMYLPNDKIRCTADYKWLKINSAGEYELTESEVCGDITPDIKYRTVHAGNEVWTEPAYEHIEWHYSASGQIERKIWLHDIDLDDSWPENTVVKFKNGLIATGGTSFTEIAPLDSSRNNGIEIFVNGCETPVFSRKFGGKPSITDIIKTIPGPTTFCTKLIEGDIMKYIVGEPLLRFNGENIPNMQITGLNPGRGWGSLNGRYEGAEFQLQYRLPNDTTLYTYTYTFGFFTFPLEFTNRRPKVVDAGMAVVGVQTNINDCEPNVGFQWRKYDAPDELPDSEGSSVLCDGLMEGFIKNLQTTSYYKVRAFYRANDGTEHTSEWQTFDPSDFSYFEPTVETKEPVEVGHNEVSLKAYCMRGTDEATEQGIEYAAVPDASAIIPMSDGAMPANCERVVCDGQVMEVHLDNLLPETDYAYRAYAIADGETYYGEIHTFTTAADPSSGVGNVISGQGNDALVISTYNIYGIPVGDSARGLIIEVLSDGTTRKVLRR